MLYRCCSAGTLSSSRPYLLQKIVYFSCEDLSGTRLQILMVERKQYLVTFLLSFEVLYVHLQRACFIPPFLSYCCFGAIYIERKKFHKSPGGACITVNTVVHSLAHSKTVPGWSSYKVERL